MYLNIKYPEYFHSTATANKHNPFVKNKRNIKWKIKDKKKKRPASIVSNARPKRW